MTSPAVNFLFQMVGAEIPTERPVENVEWVAIAFIWILFGIGAANIAKSKGESGGEWFVIGFLLGPFGLLFALFSGGKKCPYCRSSIHKAATKCPKCQSNLTPTSFQAVPSSYAGDKPSASVAAQSKGFPVKVKIVMWLVGIIALTILIIANLKK